MLTFRLRSIRGDKASVRYRLIRDESQEKLIGGGADWAGHIAATVSAKIWSICRLAVEHFNIVILTTCIIWRQIFTINESSKRDGLSLSPKLTTRSFKSTASLCRFQYCLIAGFKSLRPILLICLFFFATYSFNIFTWIEYSIFDCPK